jgi:Holliday junction DNA helicase RuvA
MDVEKFIDAVESEDLAVLESVPGLGRKTAQKVVLKLKGTLTPAAGSAPAVHDDIVAALLGMGFDRREARQAVGAVADQLEADSLSHEDYERELLKLAIRKIGQSK